MVKVYRVFATIILMSSVALSMTLNGQPGGDVNWDLLMGGDDDATAEVDSLAEVVVVVEPGLAPFRASLTSSVDSLAVEQVVVNEDFASRQALQPYEDRELGATVDGYRVGIYFNNSAQARSGAIAIMKQCEEKMGDIIATMSYDNPYFKVSVGYCTSEEEAVIMLNRVQKHFPKAYLMREQISVQNIIDSREQELTYMLRDQAMMTE